MNEALATAIDGRHVILTGFMGTGKSSIGRILAKQWRRPCVDVDRLIEQKTGKTIPEIFETQGEAAFRALEAEVFAEALATTPPAVISTGGGTLLNPDSARRAREAGLVVCLLATPEAITNRVKGRSAERRPLFTADPEQLRGRLAERAPAYSAAAHVAVDSSKLDHAAVAKCIERALERYASPGRATVDVAAASHSYQVEIGYDLLAEAGLRCAERLRGRRALLVSDETVAPLYLSALERSFLGAGFRTATLTLPPGEGSKTFASLLPIYDAALAAGLDRDDLIVALGGGVIGDVVGFAAATYLRGVAVAQVPTTLLAQIDASIGGKTAVNHPRGKNLIGAFHPPLRVTCDLTTLGSLPPREWRAGLAEAVKHGVLADADYFAWLEAHRSEIGANDPSIRLPLVRRSVEIKKAVVEADEREAEQRAFLNLGHTVGHAIEACLDYRDWLHGEAVAAGLVAAMRLAAALGMVADDEAERVERLLAALSLPTRLPAGIAPEQILERTRADKKMRQGRLRWVLPTRIGRVTLRDDVPPETVLAVLRDLTPAS